MDALRNGIRNAVYPGHLSSLWLVFSLVSGLHVLGKPTPFDLIGKFTYFLDKTSIGWQFVACFLAALIWWLSIIFILRSSLKLLLMYKGWMYERRGKGTQTSLLTKVWFLCVKTLIDWNKPRLYSFQGLLPRLPLPSLHDTITRYLRSVRPLLDDATYERTQQLATDFQSGIGRKLQLYLWLKSWWSNNYVSDWWEEYLYLRGRYPLIINSNYYGMDAIFVIPTTNQAARAASAIHSFLALRKSIKRQELQPIMIQGVIPLCSWQYERTFNTTRIPGSEADKIVHLTDSNHIVVYHKGRYFKVVVHEERILKPCEIQIQIQQILDDKSEPLPGEERLAALTAGERAHWASTRQRFFAEGVNKASLDAIEKAAFVVTLDDFPYEYDAEDPSKLEHYAKALLHGKGHDRWFDKAYTLCIGDNGRVGINSEHSWADGLITGHMWENLVYDELTDRFDENGNTIGEPELTPPTPTRLTWEIDHECQEAIQTSMKVVKDLIEDTDLRIYVNHYGKGFIKSCRVGPDAYMQMALQLAYYRDAGQFTLTYEATTTRLYKEGRTETVRPCSIESSAWVRAMEDPKSTTDEKIRLLKQACERHQTAYQDAMCGRGIDRHLFGLYVLSKYLEVESPFLREVLSEPWKLSTSQTPQGQTGRIDLNKHPRYVSAGGGFGPTADDGYGIAYFIGGEDLLFFHISSKRSSRKTDSARFARAIQKALSDMKALYVDSQSRNGNK